ncbi:bestrophin-like domain [Edaphobacter albus]|uniref:bestrophin-like domain n=1 Tax=Edaphobacter sp. 4G125 TaxID=2763071 RepID=UPI001647FC8F|nr:hypothetical protein [Edaphobacter sp. 4G125]QNI37709.1 hypothetical protein H7846_05330 [Edaphobacter sp. 4G125]
MESLLNYPRLVFLISFFVLWLAAWIGGWLQQRRRLDEDLRTDFNLIQGATLTLLGLIIGFSFSMAIGRYDQRKTYEEAEANAIGTEYVRADLLPQADANRIRDLLRRYTDLRIAFYETRDHEELKKIALERASVQDQLWQAVVRPVTAQPSPLTTLAVAGMNDVINSQGYTQAAWWNRIPESAWGLMFLIAIFANGLLGYGAKRLQPKLFIVLPLVVSISFFLIADIDSPRRGVIRVHPQNLESLRDSLR